MGKVYLICTKNKLTCCWTLYRSCQNGKNLKFVWGHVLMFVPCHNTSINLSLLICLSCENDCVNQCNFEMTYLLRLFCALHIFILYKHVVNFFKRNVDDHKRKKAEKKMMRKKINNIYFLHLAKTRRLKSSSKWRE